MDLKRLIRLIILALLLGCASASTDSKQIQDVFEEYKKNIASKNGEAAVALLDSASLAYFEEIRTVAVHGFKQQFESLSFLDKLFVLSFYTRIPLNIQKSKDISEVLQFAINNGLIGQRNIEKLIFKELHDKEQNKAIAEIATESNISNMNIVFHREDNVWKINLVSVVRFTEGEILHLLEYQEITEKDFLKNSLENMPKPWYNSDGIKFIE